MTEYDKKQARMIKNREAATLSRKRRKVCCVTGNVYIFVTGSVYICVIIYACDMK